MAKVGLYAIAKNEMKNLEAWLNNMDQGLDYIAILDTGSTDGTWEFLQEKASKDSRYIIKQEIIKPWRFDVARNHNLDMLPLDCDICVCTDEDERWLTKDWVNLLREKWIVGTTWQAGYRFDWKMDKDGVTPLHSFGYSKIHKREDLYWKYPVHEDVQLKSGERVPLEHCINLWDELILQHFPDKEKPRGYNPLIKLRVEEFNDTISHLYLALALAGEGKEEEAIKWYTKVVEHPDKTLRNETERAYCAYQIGLINFNNGDKRKALKWFRQATQIEPSYCDPWVELCRLYIQKKMYGPALKAIENCIYLSHFKNTWLEDKSIYEKNTVYLLASDCAIRCSNYKLGKIYAEKALKIDPESIDAQNLLKFINSRLEKNF